MNRKAFFAVALIICGICLLTAACINEASRADYPLEHNEILAIIPSEDGKRVAYVFRRNAGGATVGKTYDLTVLWSWEGFKDKKANAYASDYPFSVEWTSNDELAVYTRPSMRGTDKKVRGVMICFGTS